MGSALAVAKAWSHAISVWIEASVEAAVPAAGSAAGSQLETPPALGAQSIPGLVAVGLPAAEVGAAPGTVAPVSV